MGKNTIAIALTYCGAVIGAGFATGREVVLFFTGQGRPGLLGVGLATLLFIFVGVAILDITLRNRVYSYIDLLKIISPWKWPVVFIDLVLLASLWIGIGVMAAAAGRVLAGWGLSYPFGCALFLAVCLGILKSGGEGFVKANCWLVPGLALAIFFLCGGQIYRPVLTGMIDGPLRSSLLYVSFNTAIAAVALSTLKDKLDRRGALWGGILGGLLLGAMLALVFGATAGLEHSELPLLELAKARLGKWQWSYALALLAAVFTTALANIHGLASRLTKEGGYWRWSLLIAGGGYFISQVGFATLVAYSYPLLGLCNIVLLAGLCYYKFGTLTLFRRNR